MVKFGTIAGAPHVVFLETKCAWWARKETSVALRVADWRVHGRISLWSGPHCNWPFSVSKDFCRILESLVSWQAQYLAMLEGDSCCSAGCIWRFSPLPTFLLISWNVIFHGRLNEWWCWRVTEVGLCYVNVGWTILNNFLWYGGMSCFVASAMFGDVEGDSWCSALCQWQFSRLPNTPLIFWNVIFRGRRSVWWCWRPVATRDVNDGSAVCQVSSVIFHGRRNIWWCWNLILLAPRNVHVTWSCMCCCDYPTWMS